MPGISPVKYKQPSTKSMRDQANEFASIKKKKKNKQANEFAGLGSGSKSKQKQANEFMGLKKKKPVKQANEFAGLGSKKKKAPVKTSGSYKIKSGDTMSAIAKKRGTTVAEIMKANPSIKDKNKIFAGKSLKIPGNKVVKKKKIDFSKIVSAAKKSKGRKAST